MQNIPERSEDELVREAQSGSREAFAELMRRSRPRLLRAATAILGGGDGAEDETQNACCLAFEHLSSFRGQAGFHTWVTVILVNQCRMRLRRQRRGHMVSLNDTSEDGLEFAGLLADGSPDPEHLLARDEMLAVLNREIRRLPGTLRQVMLLRDLEELPMPETAARLGLTMSAAKARLLRARRELTRRMQRTSTGYSGCCA